MNNKEYLSRLLALAFILFFFFFFLNLLGIGGETLTIAKKTVTTFRELISKYLLLEKKKKIIAVVNQRKKVRLEKNGNIYVLSYAWELGGQSKNSNEH